MIDVTGAVKVVTGAVIGAVTAVTRGRDPAPAVTGTVPAVTARAGRHSLSRRASGSWPLPVAHETLARFCNRNFGRKSKYL